MTDITKTICPLIYNGIATDPSGGVRPCCVFDQRYNFRGDVKDYKASKLWHDIESNFLEGKYHPGCHHCERQDQAGSSSKRTREIENYKNKYKKEKIELEHLKSIGYDLVDLRLSNKCNLSCIMCNPKSSSLILEETKNNQDTTMAHYKNIYDLTGYKDLTNPYTEENLEALTDCIQEGSRIYFTGGEPSIVKGVLKLLQTLIDTNMHEKVHIEFNSNFQTENPKFIELLKHFPRGHMMPSLDGVGLRAEYIRYPSNWDRIHKNILHFLESCPGWKFHIAPTISILSIFYLDELIEYADKNNMNLSFTNILWGPNYLNISILPQEYKDIAMNKLKKYSTPGIKNIENYMYNKQPDMERLSACRTNLNKIDTIRGNSYQKSLPILKEMFDKCL